MKMRWLAALLLVTAAGCASATSSPGDAGADLTVSNCDPKTLFSDCSTQCGFSVCIVGQATCVGTTYQCDCSVVGPCHDGGHD
ncbi:MAG TPA: hypothetical protein VF334_19865 [Polyangia bacterium]